MTRPVEPRPDPALARGETAHMTAEAAQVAKLPKWAREKIERLERYLHDARAERDAALNNTPSNTAYQRLGRHSNDDGPELVFLPDDASVLFFLDRVARGTPRIDRSGIEVSIARNPHRKPHIRISAWGSQVAVYPVAANTFNVTEVDDAP